MDGLNRLTAMQDKVLITQGMQPFAQRVAKRLPAAYVPLFGSAADVPQVLIDGGNFLRIPHPNAPAFVHEVLKRCLDREISVVIPLGIQELHPMAEARPLFSEYGIDVWVPAVNTLTQLPVIENPPKQMPLVILSADTVIVGKRVNRQFDGLSGVFTPSDSGDEMALCCVAD